MNPLVPEFILRELASGRRVGRLRAASLFADISGFTALTEVLTGHGREGAELLAAALRSYFDPVVGEIDACGGFVSTFAGDALTALFPSRSLETAAKRAGEAARRISKIFRDEPRRTNRYGEFSFAVKVGLSAGELEWGVEGEPPIVYWFSGGVVSGCAAAEHAAKAGEIAGDDAFLRAAGLEHGSAIQGARTFLPAEIALPRVPSRVSPEGGESFSPAGLGDLPPEGEFRDVTAMFVGFDAGSPPREIAACVAERVRAFGGALSRVDFGDKGALALIFFGAPVAHENDPARALDLFLDLRDHSTVGGVRGGVARGVLWAGRNGAAWRHDFTCQGNAVNMAARLMVRAARGEAIVSEAIRSGAAATHRFLAAEKVQLKGFSQKVPVRKLAGKKVAARSRRPKVDRRGLVLRGKELEELIVDVFPIVDGRSAGVTIVTGEAGAGKSMLVDRLKGELSRRSPRRILWIETACDEILRRPLNLFERAIRSRFGLTPPFDPSNPEARIEHRVRRLVERCRGRDQENAAELERLIPWLASVAETGGADEAHAKLDPKLATENQVAALASWIRAEATLVPVVFRIEDANWIDRDSRRAMTTLFRETQSLPVAFLFNWRASERKAEEALEIPAGIPVQNIELKAIGSEEIETLIALAAGGTPSPSLTKLVIERSAGNPLFVEQTVRLLRDRGNLVEGDDGLEVARGAPLLPEGVSALLVARLDQLSGAVRRVVQAGAVLGTEPPVELLADVLSEDQADPAPEIEAAVSAGIWKREEGARLVFRHALLRDAAYSMQSSAVLRRLHGRAGEMIEKRSPVPDLAHLRDLAHHFEEAEVGPKAVDYLGRAAAAARVAYRTSEALELHERLVKWIPSKGDEARRVWTEIAEERELLGRWEEALGACNEVESKGNERELLGSIWRSSRVRNRVLRLIGRLKEARTAAIGFLRIARQMKDDGAIGSALLWIAIGEEVSGRPRRSIILLEESKRRLDQVGDTRGLTLAEIETATIDISLGRNDEAHRHLDRARAHARNLDDRLLEGSVILNLGKIEKKPEAAIERYREALAIFEEIGDRWHQSVCLNNLGAAEFVRKDVDRARELYLRAVRLHERLGSPDGVVTALGNLAECDLELGNPELAVETLTRADEIAGADYEVRIFIRLFLGDALRACGRFQAAQEKLESAEIMLEQLQSPERIAEHRLFRGRLRASTGDAELARVDFLEAVRIASGRYQHIAQKAEANLRSLPPPGR